MRKRALGAALVWIGGVAAIYALAHLSAFHGRRQASTRSGS